MDQLNGYSFCTLVPSEAHMSRMLVVRLHAHEGIVPTAEGGGMCVENAG